MQPAWHVALSTAAGLLWRRRRGRFPTLWWLASLLVDVDHYVGYGLFTGRWHPGEAWYGSRDAALRRRHPRMPLHHWPLVGALMLVGRRWRPLQTVALGWAFHLVLDMVGRARPRLAYRYRRWRYLRAWYVVAARAGYRCEHCGATGPYLELHHRVPETLGGRFHPDNLVLLCPSCHDRAHARPPRAILLREPVPVGAHRPRG